MMGRTNLWYRSLTSMGVVALIATSAWSQSLTWLGTLDGYSSSKAFGVADDGSVVVGIAGGSGGWPLRAFRWTAAGGMQDLGTFGGPTSTALDISADGKVVVGGAMNRFNNMYAFRWTESSGFQQIGTLGGNFSEAYGVSLDGSVVVGWSDDRNGRRHAFRWTASGGMQDLGTLGGASSLASSVSANGLVVVGWAQNSASQTRAFRWTEQGGMQDLGTLDNLPEAIAYQASSDGSVVVGWCRTRNFQSRAFRWTASGGMQDLGWNREACGVTADGLVVVGRPAFRWKAQDNSIEDLNIVYSSLLNGSRIEEINDISADGRYIVGGGYNAQTRRTEAFLLDTYACVPRNGDTDGDCLVNDIDLLAVLLAFGQQGNADADMNCDGTVNDVDLLTVLLNFGSGEPC